MANVISVTVYDFGTSGNKIFKTNLMGLPSTGAFVSGLGTAPREGVYVYSKIYYPDLGLAAGQVPEFLTAETVAEIIAKFNA